ncbi:DNA-directed RNA polymerase subunit beta' [Candidatus Gottesmanbacteria bacterium]|nr:DNA-directed RNA polymerase subunit beta' [Candidatus Gottesmanbacteria bacterium]
MDKQTNLNNIADFSGLLIKLASPDEIKHWSYGEVTKPETINYRTLRPEKDGLFDERIFGPTKDWECYCGKYKRIRYKGIICDKCGVEVTQSRVRRERMGHIELATAVAHVWFAKGAPSKMSLLLGMTPRELEGIIYYAKFLVTEVNDQKRKEATKSLDKKKKERTDEIVDSFKEQIKEVEKQFEKERKDISTKQKNKEVRDLTLDESKFKERQRVISLEEKRESEKTKLEGLFKQLNLLVGNIKVQTVLSEEEYLSLSDYGLTDFFDVRMGAGALINLIKALDLVKIAADLRNEAKKVTGQKHIKITKRLRVVEAFKNAVISPSWMILKNLPVLPPDLRPMVQLTGGRFATSDLNDLYRRVINRNNRLKHLMDLGAPEIILRNEKRMLQEAVDSLIDTTQKPQVRRTGQQKLRSLSEMLRGKQGRFRQNLLGKRVDYSGRSVIVVGPELSLYQCGLPKEMALEMFKPFVLRELIARGVCPNVKSAKNFLDERHPQVFDILEEITKNHPVLLNRAPTLHKLGIQAFYPILIEGSAIRIHPCVCAGYNADFDGDQMAVHIPLSDAAQEEARRLMLPVANLLKPADGSLITFPNKEMVLGCYYVTTLENSDSQKTPKIFAGVSEALYAYQTKKLPLREKIAVNVDGKRMDTSVGRILFNELLPQDLRFINKPVKAADLKKIITDAMKFLDSEKMVLLIDAIKDLGFWGSTLSGGLSVSVFDCLIVPEKKKLVTEAEKKVYDIESNYSNGLITLEEKRRLSNDIWIETTEKLADETWKILPSSNPVKMIIDSGGARASRDQLKQLSAMRGLSVDPLGKIVELPTKSNFREGLSIFEYVTSTRGSRKGLTDSALKTADAGYLTRRLVDVAHDVIVRLEDCKTDLGIYVYKEDKRRTSFAQRINGRIAGADIKDGKKVIVEKNTEISDEQAQIIETTNGIDEVMLRSPLTCNAKYGICQLCYGRDLATRKLVEIGTPAGVVAAQSIGEPGTQLTMRVRHAGGIVGLDVTQGLPRVEELFETRTPKVRSPIVEISGKVKIADVADGIKVLVVSQATRPQEVREYIVPLTSQLLVKDGQLVSSGQQITSGYLDIKEVLSVRGLRGVQKYLIDEVQKVYESQGIPINDKHFEVIIKKMSDKVRVETAGDTDMLPGELVDKATFEEKNGKVLAEGGDAATAQVVVLGITIAALYTDSWLSAASFQETTSILTEAASAGKKDHLLGLKENVIIGRLIPVSEDRAVIKNE